MRRYKTNIQITYTFLSQKKIHILVLYISCNLLIEMKSIKVPDLQRSNQNWVVTFFPEYRNSDQVTHTISIKNWFGISKQVLKLKLGIVSVHIGNSPIIKGVLESCITISTTTTTVVAKSIARFIICKAHADVTTIQRLQGQVVDQKRELSVLNIFLL